jgi:PAT family beta-lactamase induction signal transducer AmpG
MKAMSRDVPVQAAKRPWWILTTYYAEGFPYSLVRLMSTAYFKDHGASLEAIGLTSLFGIPWILKLLWAPFVDAFASKRRWLLATELSVVVGIAALGFASTLPRPLAAGAVIFMLLAILAATHDIAIDGYYLEALDRTAQARYVGLQSAAYRVAMITGGGVIAFVCGHWTWLVGYLVAAAVMALLFLLHASKLPAFETSKRPFAELAAYLLTPRHLAVVGAAVVVVGGLWAVLRSPTVTQIATPLRKISAPMWIVIALAIALAVLAARAPALKRKLYDSDSHYAMAFIDYLDRPRIGVVLAFILTYRIGESMLQNMAYPFLSDIGITLEQYGLAHNTFGIIATIVGSIAGGALIARFGFKRCLWPFVLALNSLNVLYMLLALKYSSLLQHPGTGAADFSLVAALITLEQLGAGFGNAALAVFIMRTTKADYKAAHFAIGTGLMNIAGTMAGVFSGFVASAVGFPIFFGMTFLLTIPNMALIPWLPLDDKQAPDR